MKACFSQILGAVSLTLCFAVNGQELRVIGALAPTKIGVSLPKLQAHSDDAKLEAKGEGTWTYRLTTDKLLGTTTVGFDSLPADYHTVSLSVRMPARREKSLKVSLYAVKVQDTVRRVAEIYGTDITNGQLRSDELFRLYQEAAYLSSRRLDTIRQEPRPFYAYDAKIFFKYLEIARELGRGGFIVMSESVQKVQGYLREQLGQDEGKSAITKGLGRNGISSTQQIVDEIDLVDAEQLRQVWQSVASVPPKFTQDACDGYFAFLKTLDDFDDRLVAKWNKIPSYNMATLAVEAVSTCATKLAENSRKDSVTTFARAEELENIAKLLGSKEYAVGNFGAATKQIERTVQLIKPPL